MKLLILGGTRFVGRHLVTAALERDHEITLFNRGTHAPQSSTRIETIYGNRNSDLAKLRDRRWDVVVDTCGYLPRTVRASAQALAEAADIYVFISSQSVYSDLSVVGVDETAPLATLTNNQLEQANAVDSSGSVSAVTYGKMYGGLKALCESEAETIFPNRLLVIRPGLIVGPDDYTDRFTYWVVRVALGGEVLAPGRPQRQVQFIDVRDVADWIVGMIERKQTGVYNVNGLTNKLTMEGVLHECRVVTGSEASFTWVTEDFLIQENIAAWTQMPLWLPERVSHLRGFMFINCDKAVQAGLSFRPLQQTINDTLTWWKTERSNQKLKCGIETDKEEALLRKWHESRDNQGGLPLRKAE